MEAWLVTESRTEHLQHHRAVLSLILECFSERTATNAEVRGEERNKNSICEILEADLASAETLAHTGTTSAGAHVTHDVAEAGDAATAAATVWQGALAPAHGGIPARGRPSRRAGRKSSVASAGSSLWEAGAEQQEEEEPRQRGPSGDRI